MTVGKSFIKWWSYAAGIIIFCAKGSFTTQNETVDLLKNLFQYYDIAIRPSNGSDQAVDVNLGIALMQIVELNQQHQILTSNVWIRQYWTDTNLAWNTENPSALHIPASRIWKPDLVIYNNADQKFEPMYDDVIALLRSDGKVNYMYPAQFQTFCALKTYYFPFDEQNCRMKFGSWSYDNRQLSLSIADNAADVQDYVANSEWALVKMTVEHNLKQYGCCSELFPDITFWITIRRRALMHVFYLLVPNILISVLTIVQFILPCDCAEKVSLGITLMLSLVVYLLLLTDILPVTSEVPMMAQYFLINLAVVTLSLLATFFTLYLHHNGKHDNHMKLPYWARQLFLKGLARLLCMTTRITSDGEHISKLQPFSEILISETSSPFEEDDSPSQENNLVRKTTSQIIVQKPSTILPTLSKQDSAACISSHGALKPQSPHRSSQGPKRRLSTIGTGITVLSKLSDSQLLQCILQRLEEFKESIGAKERDIELSCEWQEVAMVLDRLLLYIFAVVTLLMYISIFVQSPIYKTDYIK